MRLNVAIVSCHFAASHGLFKIVQEKTKTRETKQFCFLRTPSLTICPESAVVLLLIGRLMHFSAIRAPLKNTELEFGLNLP